MSSKIKLPHFLGCGPWRETKSCRTQGALGVRLFPPPGWLTLLDQLGFLDLPELSSDARFATNPDRIAHREALLTVIRPALAARPTDEVIAGLEALKVPAGPVQSLDQVFASDQVAAREMQIDMTSDAGPVHLIGNPLKFSATPVTYRLAPPRFGADTDDAFASENPWEIPK